MLKENVVITGGTSFLGLALVRELLKRDIAVWALVRPTSQQMGLLPQHPCLRVVVAEPDANITWLREQLPVDAVFMHMGWAGIGGEGRSNLDIQKYNIAYSKHMLELAKALASRRFLFAGSQAEYGPHNCLITEQTQCIPASEYGKAKLAFGKYAEEYCCSLPMEYLHLRIFSVYGNGDHPWTLVQSCLKAFLNNERMELGPCTQRWNFLYVDDAAELMANMILYRGDLTPYGSIYNVGSEDVRPLREFVREIYEACGATGNYVFGQEEKRPEGVADLAPDISKVCTQFAWKPKTRFMQGIRKMLVEEAEKNEK